MLGPERRKELALCWAEPFASCPLYLLLCDQKPLSGAIHPGSQGSWCLSFLQDLRAQKVLKNGVPHH